MELFYKAFGLVLRGIYNLVGNNYIVALILFTVFFRVILLPSTISQQKGAAKQMRMQTKLKRIQEKYKDYNKPDKQQLIQQEQQELYSREGYSSMTGSCLPLLIQFPVMIGIYRTIYKPITHVLGIGQDIIQKLADGYAQVFGSTLDVGGSNSQGEMVILRNLEVILEKVNLDPEIIDKLKSFNFMLFGKIPLFDIPSTDTLKSFGSATNEARLLLLIPLFACLSSLLTAIYTQKKQAKTNQAQQMKSMSCMMFLMGPAMSLIFTFTLPAAVGIYWIISNVVGFVQTFILGYTHEPKKLLAKLMVEETIERRSKEENTKAIASKT